MDIWHLRGGNRLEGSCFVQGSKNASLPIIAASIISPAATELLNVPQLRDVDAALRILRHLGCTAEQWGGEVYIDSQALCRSEIPHSLMVEMRSSVIFLGAMLPKAVKDFRSFDRIVTVKGLCEKEVPADKVIWPLVFKVVGNDISSVYSEINRNTEAIKQFLTDGGISEEEITVAVPVISDKYAQEYGNNDRTYRYLSTNAIQVRRTE